MKKYLHTAMTIAAGFLVMLAVFLVRAPAAYLADTVPELRPEFMNESDEIYMMEMDSYYHTRITDNYLKYGSLGDTVSSTGEPWDSGRYYPEGRSAVYQPGIVYVTVAVWKVLKLFTGVSLYTVELWMAVFLAAVSGLLTFLLVRRLAGNVGGFVAGVLVSCQSVFAERTMPGRYDTDMFVVLMDVLLIFLFYEGMKAEAVKKKWALLAGFVLTIAAYAMCWSRYSILLGALTVAGGFLYIFLMFVKYAVTGKKEAVKSFEGQKELQILLAVAAVSVVLLLITKGPEYIKELIINLLPARLSGKANAEPDLFSSVVELRVPEIVPEEFHNWLLSYVPGQMFTVLNGVGGLTTVVLCLGGMLLLVLRILLPASFSNIVPLKRRHSALLLCILTVWMVGCFIATNRGVRFVEHLGVPIGVSAGLFAGWIAPETDKGKLVFKISGVAVSIIICVASVVIPLSGVLGISRYIQPCVTDASDRAMNWIRDNAEDPEAVIASWWDMGYYYGYASGHPTFWDGGCQTGTRAMLVAKALTTHDPEETGAILQMLANEGNRAVDYLKTRLGIEDAFHSLWEAIMLPQKEAREVFEKYGLDEDEAGEVEEMVHPSEKKEVYLVLTNTMMDMLGWFEYYADWDFKGDNKVPYATVYYVKSDGTATMDMQQEEAKKYFEKRSHETIWRLFLSNGEQQDTFEKVYETTDRFAYVQIWKLKGTERKGGQ